MGRFFLNLMNLFMPITMNKSFSLLIFCLMPFFWGCSSFGQPKEVFELPDYTEEQVFLNEKKRISSISEETPVQALWRSGLLKDEEGVKEYSDKLFADLKQYISENRIFDAWQLYSTLKNTSYEGLKDLQVSEKQLFVDYMKNVPGMTVEKSLLPQNMQQCIEATATIWVDKGIAIHNGVGYADRVLGSGFFIDKRGYLITNHHVINDLVDPKYEGYSRLYIRLASDQDTRIPARVIGYDDVLDLALLKVEIDPPYVLQLGSSQDLHVGDKVSAIGTPLGLHGTLTSGIVSAVDRKLFTTGSVLQIDAAVNSGNSGGPLIDQQMKVQAIVFAGILQYQGLNFAIPVEYLRQDLPFLYHGGKRKHVWIGAYGHTKKELNRNSGLEVQYVMPGGVAFRAGLKKGDVITSVGGRKVYSLENVQDVFRSYSSESIIPFEYQREGNSYDGFLYLEQRPKQPGYEIYKSDILTGSFIPIFGMEMIPSSTLTAKKYTVTDVIKGSVADESGFSATDPVYVSDVDFSEEKDAISVTMNTRKRKKGYLDITIRIGSQLDSPYYF